MRLIGQSSSSASASAARAQVPVQASTDELPYLVRRDRQLIAAFAQKSEANNWAREFSNYRDSNSTFFVHTAAEILSAYRDGNEVEVP
jgi:hypothetical protein